MDNMDKQLNNSGLDEDPILSSQQQPNIRSKKTKHKKKTKTKRIFLLYYALLILLFVVPVVFIYCGPLAKINYRPMPVASDNSEFLKQQQEIQKSEFTIDNDFEDTDSIVIMPTQENLVAISQANQEIENIAFFGLDVRQEGSQDGRSDIIMILSIDQANKKIRAASILRDCYVQIPGHKKGRINAAYAYGGPALAINTINLNFSTDIQKYVKVDFFGMEKIIDMFGGIRLDELSEAEAGQIRKYLTGSTVQAGKDVLLNGKEAVLFARIRKIDSDFNRTDRQRAVLQQMANKLFDMNFGQAVALLDQIMPNIETNLTKNEILSLGWQTMTLGYDKNIEQLRIPTNDAFEFANINGASVILPNIRKNTDALHKFLYGVESK
ncbi:Transcriptional regulator LytR [bioreactor metagenome]|uniref:Transcriptional regulator LytR n=1 Tax=bioreactor metagenome TaxID=1076179 RepID=A0A645AJY5_9ZZZZ